MRARQVSELEVAKTKHEAAAAEAVKGRHAELRQLVSRIEPGVRAQILVRPRLGEIVVFEWDGTDDGIYLRLRCLRRDESLAPN